MTKEEMKFWYRIEDAVIASGMNKSEIARKAGLHRQTLSYMPNPENKPQVNHIDGNNQNNSVTNLEWVTNEENCRKAIALRAEQIGARLEQCVSDS